MTQFNDLTGQTFGDWKVIEYCGPGTRKYVCKCIKCGNIKEITSYGLTKGTQRTCRECAKRAKKVEVGQKFGEWTVIGLVEDRPTHVLCRCQCGKEKQINKYTLLDGRSTNCGHLKNLDRVIDLKGQRFGELTVIQYMGGQYWKCKCSCGYVCVKHRNHLLDGRATKCGSYHGKIKNNLSGMKFTNLTVLSYLGNTVWKCRCICGKIIPVFEANLLNLSVRQCGCTYKYIDDTQAQSLVYAASKRLGRSMQVKNFDQLLGVDESQAKQYLFRCDNLSNITGESILGQREVIQSLKDIIRERYTGTIVENYTIEDFIVDLYLPDLQLAINYQESYEAIRNSYTYLKSLYYVCKKNNIRLFNIMGYDWSKRRLRNKISDHIKNIISDKRIRLGKNSITIEEIERDQAEKFLNDFDVMNFTDCQVYIGCKYNNKIIGVQGYGVQRYNDNYTWELIRMYFDPKYYADDAEVIMQSTFERIYKPENIIQYCDVQMYQGKVYERMGYQNIGMTKPGYVWISGDRVLTRYKTTKYDLVRLGLGDDLESEAEIMQRNGFRRIFNCGNKVYVKNFNSGE